MPIQVQAVHLRLIHLQHALSRLQQGGFRLRILLQRCRLHTRRARHARGSSANNYGRQWLADCALILRGRVVLRRTEGSEEPVMPLAQVRKRADV